MFVIHESLQWNCSVIVPNSNTSAFFTVYSTMFLIKQRFNFLANT